ncbi:MAG: RNA polymerase sigma factor [Actinomycetota bacterium]|nr:RNA polymerase sigma factor [Actinomycetota bacterium]
MTSDAELIGRSVSGDDEAFVELLHRHEAAVWAYVARRVGRGQAKDLVSEVWIAAFGARCSYDPAFPGARPWLFGIARNVLRRHWRARLDEDLEADMEALAKRADPWPVVDERLDGAAILRRILTQLRPEEREVLLLVVWDELSISEAARTVGVPAGTARYHLHRARVALRAAAGLEPLLAGLDAVQNDK